MKNLETIKLTQEFKQFCDIFNFTPQEVLQAFIDQVDIAQYMCFHWILIDGLIYL